MLIEQEASYKSSLGLMKKLVPNTNSILLYYIKKMLKTAPGLLKKQETHPLLLDRCFEHQMWTF